MIRWAEGMSDHRRSEHSMVNTIVHTYSGLRMLDEMYLEAQWGGR